MESLIFLFWAHFRRFAPETGVCNALRVPLLQFLTTRSGPSLAAEGNVRSILHRFNPLRGPSGALFGLKPSRLCPGALPFSVIRGLAEIPFFCYPLSIEG